MNVSPRSALALSLLVLSCAGRSTPARAPTPASSVELPRRFEVAAVDAYIAAEVTRHAMVGAQVAIVRDGELVLARGYGKRDLASGAPVDAATIFGIGSVSKQFTCAAALLLADDGKLSMRDPVARWFPELPRAADMTLADLGGHTAGVHDYYPLDFVDGRMRQAITPQEIVTRYVTAPLDFEPGARRSYSNTGFVLLGRIVEKASGERFTDFLAERVLRRLGLERTSHDRPSGEPNLATGYTAFLLGAPEPTPPESREWMWGAGAMYSTASDLARWDLALIDGKLLSAAGFAAMTSSRTLTDGRSSDYGCGLGVRRAGGQLVLRHTGAVSGYLAYNAFVPRTRSAVVLLLNSEHADGTALWNALIDLIVDEPGDVPEVTGPPADAVVRDLFRQLQAGKVDRTRLGAAYSAYLDDARLASAAARLRALGEPTEVVVTDRRERGGMEVSSVNVVLHDRTLSALLYRTPDGKVQELLFGED